MPGVLKAAPAAPRPALPALGSALGGPPSAPAPSHRQRHFPKAKPTRAGRPSSSLSIVRLAAAASRAALRAVARRSATPTLDPAATHLVLAPTRKAGTKQLIGTISRSPRLLGARSKQPFR